MHRLMEGKTNTWPYAWRARKRLVSATHAKSTPRPSKLFGISNKSDVSMANKTPPIAGRASAADGPETGTTSAMKILTKALTAADEKMQHLSARVETSSAINQHLSRQVEANGEHVENLRVQAETTDKKLDRLIAQVETLHRQLSPLQEEARDG